MYFLRKTFELAVCLFGYWVGRGFGGWGGGILLAFAGLCASSFGWEWLARNVFAGSEQPSASEAFRLWSSFNSFGLGSRPMCCGGNEVNHASR